MVLEATMLDNSEWMRNGDFVPSRLEAQADAVNLIFSAKTQSNPENTVGLMTMAGKSPEVLVTLTAELGKILAAMHTVKISGKSSLSHGIQVAQLVLKHRQNKNQRQRIIVFVGSPLAEDEKALVKLGKKLKKNNVAVDIINFGQDENTAKLEALVDACNSSDNSRFISVSPGPHILSDVLVGSSLLADDSFVGAGSSGGAGFEFGVDPSLDPELALALRLSMEEEQARHDVKPTTAEHRPSQGGAAPMVTDNEDALLAQALAMSVGGQTAPSNDMDVSEEDDEIARAIQMSMDQGKKDDKSPEKKNSVQVVKYIDPYGGKRAAKPFKQPVPSASSSASDTKSRVQIPATKSSTKLLQLEQSKIRDALDRSLSDSLTGADRRRHFQQRMTELGMKPGDIDGSFASQNKKRPRVPMKMAIEMLQCAKKRGLKEKERAKEEDIVVASSGSGARVFGHGVGGDLMQWSSSSHPMKHRVEEKRRSNQVKQILGVGHTKQLVEERGLRIATGRFKNGIVTLSKSDIASVQAQGAVRRRDGPKGKDRRDDVGEDKRVSKKRTSKKKATFKK